MAKRTTSSTDKAPAPVPAAKSKAPAPEVAATTPVRNTAIPKPAKPATKSPKPMTYELISERAYFISISGTGGSQDDNWLRAESELLNENG